jgi:2-dehydro-3-deoxygluconokinase
MSASFVCFGELLLRLAAPARELLLQTSRLDVQVGGAEANVAVSLARFGHRARVASVVPASPLGSAAIGELRRHGVDTSAVVTGDGRMGLYFLSTGALQRPSEVIYDRADSAFARSAADRFDWGSLLVGCDRLHLSGVTPALGAEPAAAALRAACAARDAGVPVSFDGNYRGKLWQVWNGDAPRLLRELMAEADLLFADHRDLEVVLGHTPPQSPPAECFADAAAAAFAAFPRLQRFTSTHRQARSVDQHALGAWMATREGALHVASTYAMDGIVDRIGGGDAFAAGVLHGLHSGLDDARSLNFGLAAACLKHSIPGDFNLASLEDVEALVASGRLDVKR